MDDDDEEEVEVLERGDGESCSESRSREVSGRVRVCAGICGGRVKRGPTGKKVGDGEEPGGY